MSNLSPCSRRGRIAHAIPRGDVLGTYETYLEAQSVVDRLSKADFEIKGLAIVGNNLTSVEQVTGKLTYGRTAIAGAARGAWFGLFIGLMFFLFTPVPVTGYIVAAAVIGAGISMVFSVVMYTLGRRTRDFTSTNHVLARSYDIIVSPALLLRARTILAQPAHSAQPAQSAQPGLAPAPELPAARQPDAQGDTDALADTDAAASAPAAETTSSVAEASAAHAPAAAPLVPAAPAAAAPAVPAVPARARPAYGELAPEALPDAAPAAAPATKPRAKRTATPPVDPEAKD